MTPAQGRTMYVCPLANAQVQVAPEEEARVMNRRHSDFSLLNSDLGARPHPIEEDDCHECMRAQGKRCCAALFPAPCAAILHLQINAFLDQLHPSLLNPTCMPEACLPRECLACTGRLRPVFVPEKSHQVCPSSVVARHSADLWELSIMSVFSS